jgi:diguanylate cyclase (GGDEF)-like protein/PAS domain S-box-containing protein
MTTYMTNINDEKVVVESAKLKHLFSASKAALISGALLATVLAYMQRDVVANHILIGWFVLFLIVTLARFAQVNAFQRSQAGDYDALYNRLVKFRLGVLMAGLVWGSTSFLMLPVIDQQHQIFLLLILAGITAAGMVLFSADFVSAIIYPITILSPLIFNLLLGQANLSSAMGIAVLLYLGFIIMSSRQINLNLLENIHLNLQAVEKGNEARRHANNLELNNQILSQINQRTALPIMLEELALDVEAIHSNMMCSILLLDNDGKTLRHGAAPSLPDFYNQAIDGLEIGAEVGSCGAAAFLGERVIAEDIMQHPNWVPYRDLASKAGLKSCWSQPFRNKDGQVLGTFAIYHNQITQPNEEEKALILGYANLAQLAIESSRAQNSLSISAIAFESKDGLLVTDADKKILRVNHSFIKITGYAEADVTGQIFGMHGLVQRDENLYASIWNDIENVDACESEFSGYRKTGELYPEQVAITKVKDSNGNVTNYVVSITDITASKAATEEIQLLAYYDPLTKLPNRRLLVDRLGHALGASARSGRDGALLFLDLDHFKTLNDSLGHDVGDMLLQEVAKRLIDCVREGDTVARLGGDEYLVMLVDLSTHAIEAAAQSKLIGERILDSLNKPYYLANNLYQSTASIGIALFSNHDQSIDDLLKHADIAMYQAKKFGRNTMRFFDPQMQETIHARVALEGELRKAHKLKQFSLHYQIQVDHLGNALGAEALIRWHHPERGLISPFHFIPLAEETGLILPIGQWVLEAACAQLKAWKKNVLSCDLTISINVSAKQFRQENFVEKVKATVRRYAVNPSLLKLELTEGILVESVESTILTMNALKEIGIQFSLDDFGTGYSSLQYLKRLPLYQLKIDQSFVREIVVDSSDKAIVQTIIAMAKSMELEVIAEGVETEEQQNILWEKGCMKYQGYLFGKPIPIEEFNAILHQKKPYFQSNLKSLSS